MSKNCPVPFFLNPAYFSINSSPGKYQPRQVFRNRPMKRLAVLAGDPSKSGVYVLRLRLPNGYKIPPHYHPTDEHVTVLAGTSWVGMGDTAKTRGMTRLTGGGFITVLANAHHYARAQGVTVLQVSGEGPFEITYVNSADDPRNKKAAMR